MVALKNLEVARMYDEYGSEYQTPGSSGDVGLEPNDEISGQGAERFPTTNQDQYGLGRLELRAFLVACHQAAVSIETMSRQLGIDEGTVRSELILGLERWTAAQCRFGYALL